MEKSRLERLVKLETEMLLADEQAKSTKAALNTCILVEFQVAGLSPKTHTICMECGRFARAGIECKHG